MAKSALVLGAGNVGRGFLGQLFSESGYQVVFVDIDEQLVALLNARGSYLIRMVENDDVEEIKVAPVRALRAEQTTAIAQMLTETSIAATAVGVRALPKIAPLIAAGISQRAIQGIQVPLNVIVCENLKDAALVLRGLVAKNLSEADQEYFRTQVGFVDTVIGRMIPPPAPKTRVHDPSLVIVEPYKELPVDRSGFVGTIPTIEGMVPCDHFAMYVARKLYVHNCGHAMLGYLGYLRGYVFGYQALDDATIHSLLNDALAESKKGIVKVYGADEAWLQAHISDIVRRFANRALSDTIFRLARDPLRKLSPADRLIGAARLSEMAGNPPFALSWGIAAGYCFDAANDPLAVALQRHIASEGLDSAMADVSGIDAREPLAHLVRERYHKLQYRVWP